MHPLGLLPPFLAGLALLLVVVLLAVDRGPAARLYRRFEVPSGQRRAIAIVGMVICVGALFGVIGAALGWFSSTG